MITDVTADHEWVLSCSNGVTADGTTTGQESVTVGWGATQDFVVQVKSVFTAGPPRPVSSYSIGIVTPWGDYANTVTGALFDNGYIRIRMTNGLLTKNADCTGNLSFDSLVFYKSYEGGAETTLLTIGAQSVPIAGFDQRLNTDLFEVQCNPAVVPPSPWLITECSTPPTAQSETASSSIGLANGPDGLPESGYRWSTDGGVTWMTYPITVDASGVPGSCPCSYSLPTVAGTDSFNIVLTSNYQFVITVSGVTTVVCPCSGGGDATFNSISYTQNFSSETASLSLMPTTTAIGTTEFIQALACNGSETTHTTTSSSTPTYCGEGRSTNGIQSTLTCVGGSIPVGCTYDPTCAPVNSVSNCEWIGSAGVAWITPIPCAGGRALGYDVSNAQRHVVVYGVAGTNELIMGCAGNVLPQTYSWADTGLTGVWARPRFQDLGSSWPIGLFYGDGTNCLFGRTFDEGATWVGVLSMGSGSVGDFDEGANGLRWFFKLETPDMGTTWNVWGQLMDSQLNVVRAWTETNVTGVDNAPIAVRESATFDGSWRIGLFYSVGGVQTVKFSMDGLSFS